MGVRVVTLTFRARIMRGDEPAWLKRHPRRAYIVQLLYATPPWVSRREIRRIEAAARRRSLKSGARHVVDHIVPLTHPRICGLNWHGNMQILPGRSNARKSNHWHDGLINMFSTPEQFTLL
jgi:hypothetical protein